MKILIVLCIGIVILAPFIFLWFVIIVDNTKNAIKIAENEEKWLQ